MDGELSSRALEELRAMATGNGLTEIWLKCKSSNADPLARTKLSPMELAAYDPATVAEIRNWIQKHGHEKADLRPPAFGAGK